MSREKRMKATDVFRKASHAFHSGPSLSFEEAFPRIEQMLIEVEEIGDGVDRDSSGRQYTKSSFGEYINRSNPICHNGGFSIDGVLRVIIANKQSDLETTKRRQGYEGSAKRRRRYRRCFNRLKIELHIGYREPLADGRADDNSVA